VLSPVLTLVLTPVLSPVLRTVLTPVLSFLSSDPLCTNLGYIRVYRVSVENMTKTGLTFFLDTVYIGYRSIAMHAPITSQVLSRIHGAPENDERY